MSDQENTRPSEALLQQMRALSQAINALAGGDFTRKVSLEAPEGAGWNSEQREVAQALNGLMDQLSQFAHEATRISSEIGNEGRFGGQMEVEGARGTWKDLADSINRMAYSLTDQVRDIASVTASLANGDASRRVTVGAQGEVGQLKSTINALADQLDSDTHENPD